MKIDAEKEGQTFARRYDVHGYPTILFVRAGGKEVERIIGYLPAEEFLAEIERINRGEDTYESLYLGSFQDQSNLDLALKLGLKLDERGDYGDAVEVWERVQGLAEPGSETISLSGFKTVESKARSTDNSALLEDYLSSAGSTVYHTEAFRALIRIYRKNEAGQAEAKTYLTLVDHLTGTPEFTTGLLNGYAWRMTQLNTNLEDALEKIILAVDMAGTEDGEQRSELLDTQAEVLWKLGRIDQAIEIMNMCIELVPDRQYFLDQKAKFEASKTPA
jgi:tetratricopeptide (TPR) repeat protein